MGLGWSKVGLGRQVEAVEVKCKGCGMGASGVEHVTEVHEESVAAPLEESLNERVGELGPVEEVGGHDSDGMGRPGHDVGVFGW